MNYQTEKTVKIICIVLSVILAAALAALLYADYQKSKATEARLSEIAERARPYESEIRDLEKELSDLKEGQHYSSEEAEFMVGFIVSEKSDMAYISEISKEYPINPVVVIDCTADISSIAECLDEADAKWEIMLYAPSYSAGINDKVAEVRKHLFNLSKRDTGIFLLRRYNDTETNIALLKQNGFIGYTAYHESPSFGQSENGMVYFDYSLITTDSIDIAARLSACRQKKASMMVVFDISALHTGDLSESTVTRISDELEYYANQENSRFSTVTEVVAELSDINRIEAEMVAKNESRISELNEQIERLNDQINAIWAEWRND